MENKIAFIAGAILDVQSTIRAIDVKIGALLVAVLTPFSNLGRICAHFQNISQNFNKPLTLLLLIMFFGVWVLSIVSLIRGLAAIDNPAKHIVNSNKYKGSFYGGNLYNFGFLDCLLNRSIIKANKDVSTFELDIPENKNKIETELVFEQMKLIYIRDAKLHRLKWGINFASIWFILGLFSYIVSKVNI
jgi:hypothetical protein